MGRRVGQERQPVSPATAPPGQGVEAEHHGEGVRPRGSALSEGRRAGGALMPLDDARLRAGLDPVGDLWVPGDGLRDAAVLAPWFTRGGRDFLLFTLRRHDLPHHPGQVSFPGGAREGDEGPLACALRESEEELGIRAGDVRVLGAIPPRPSGAGFQVHTVVGRVPPDLVLRPDPREVAAVLELPIDELQDPTRWRTIAPPAFPQRRPSPHFERDGHVLWGLTARLVLDVLARLGA
jgi:8-oxo-dGTP pyrophosphatase MutT (NUDIX family)